MLILHLPGGPSTVLGALYPSIDWPLFQAIASNLQTNKSNRSLHRKSKPLIYEVIVRARTGEKDARPNPEATGRGREKKRQLFSKYRPELFLTAVRVGGGLKTWLSSDQFDHVKYPFRTDESGMFHTGVNQS